MPEPEGDFRPPRGADRRSRRATKIRSCARSGRRPATRRSSRGCSATPRLATSRSASRSTSPTTSCAASSPSSSATARRDDLLLLHVSCHGLKDEDGTLYFASSNTAVEHLEATAIPSEFVNRQMTKSRSRRIVLLLDCCFGGAFARGLVHRAGESVAIKEEFEGQGRVVLTASRAMEYAFEGDNREGDAQPSIFTSAIVQGLESGEADRDGDSRVSVDELYDYVYDRVREATPNQTPSKWTFDVHGDLYVARSPFREPEPVPLPVELRAAMESPFANVRAGAVEELAHLLAGADAGLAAAARIALEKTRRRRQQARVRGCGTGAEPGRPSLPRRRRSCRAPPRAEAAHELRRPSPPRPRRERSSSTTSRVAVALARATQRQDGLALAGAALLVFGYFRAASWDIGVVLRERSRRDLVYLVAARGLWRGAPGRARRAREPPRPARARGCRRLAARSRRDRVRGHGGLRRVGFRVRGHGRGHGGWGRRDRRSRCARAAHAACTGSRAAPPGRRACRRGYCSRFLAARGERGVLE